MKLLNWNVQWKRPGTPRGNLVNQVIADHHPNVACITEGFEDQFSAGHTICSAADYGYPLTRGRRKVVLWSEQPWEDIDVLGHDEMPGGRFVAGLTETPIGHLQIIGVCIPWAAAHVSTGRRDRTYWEDHLRWLRSMALFLNRQSSYPRMVVGDFNQTIPRTRAPKAVFDQLMTTLGDLKIATRGLTDATGKRAIDHVCHSQQVVCWVDQLIPRHLGDMALSDHFGFTCHVHRRPPDA